MTTIKESFKYSHRKLVSPNDMYVPSECEPENLPTYHPMQEWGPRPTPSPTCFRCPRCAKWQKDLSSSEERDCPKCGTLLRRDEDTLTAVVRDPTLGVRLKHSVGLVFNHDSIQDTPSKAAEVLATLVSLATTLPTIALGLYTLYLCVKPIFESYGILVGILSVIPLGPLTAVIQSIAFAWNGNLLPLGLLIGTYMSAQFLEPIGAVITSRIRGRN